MVWLHVPWPSSVAYRIAVVQLRFASTADWIFAELVRHPSGPHLRSLLKGIAKVDDGRDSQAEGLASVAVVRYRAPAQAAERFQREQCAGE